MISSTATQILTAPKITNPGHDPVVVAYTSQATSTDRLRACQSGLAHLYAQLRWVEGNPGQVDDLLETGRSISRRIRAIKALVELEIKANRLHGSESDFDLHSPLARNVMALLVTTLLDTTTDIIGADDADEINTRFKIAVEGNDDIPWP